MKKTVLILFMSLVLLMSLSTSSLAGKKVCKFGHVNSPASLFQYQAIEFKKAVEAELPDMTVEVYPAGQLGGTLALMQGLELNTVQIYSEFAYIWEGYVPEFKVLAVHYVFKDVEEFERFCKSALFDDINAKLAKKAGVRIIGNVDAGGTFQFLSRKPIHKMSDVKGIKNRCAQMAPLLGSWRSYGAKPTPLDWGEIYTSLATGVIDGVDNPLIDMYDEKFYEVTKYLNYTNNLQVLIAYNTSEAFWKSLTPKEQDVFKRAIEIANQKTKAEVKRRFEKVLEVLKNKGVQSIQTDTADFRKAVQDNIEKILEGNKRAIALYKKIIAGEY